MTSSKAIPAPVAGRVILASASPRRRELLGMIVPEFEVAPSIDVDETYPATLPAEDVPVYISQKKSDAYASLATSGTTLITADTVVILDGNILGKPADAAQAAEMLRALSGRTHTVVTGVTIRRNGISTSLAEKTSVHFDTLSDTDIDTYICLFNPTDKAGAYGIQEWIGSIGITGIDGDYYNVMGLPLQRLRSALVRMNQ